MQSSPASRLPTLTLRTLTLRTSTLRTSTLRTPKTQTLRPKKQRPTRAGSGHFFPARRARTRAPAYTAAPADCSRATRIASQGSAGSICSGRFSSRSCCCSASICRGGYTRSVTARCSFSTSTVSTSTSSRSCGTSCCTAAVCSTHGRARSAGNFSAYSPTTSPARSR